MAARPSFRGEMILYHIILNNIFNDGLAAIAMIYRPFRAGCLQTKQPVNILTKKK